MEFHDTCMDTVSRTHPFHIQGHAVLHPEAIATIGTLVHNCNILSIIAQNYKCCFSVIEPEA
jgi:hypothetical protein